MIKNGAVGYLTKSGSSLLDIFDAVEQVYSNGYYYSACVSNEIFAKAKQKEIPEFTEKEMNFLSLCCEGLSNKEIADKMFVSYRTVEHYYDSISRKINIKNRIGIVAFVLKTGIINV